MIEADVVVIGGGIIGTSIARELSKYKLRVILIEKEADVALGGSTRANTAIVHAGYDDVPGTLKADLCAKGNALWPRLASELNVPFKRIGSFVVAIKDDDVHILAELMRRGEKNGVPDLQMIEDPEKIVEMEPNLRKEAAAALHAPTAGITSPYEMAIALAENAARNGVMILLEAKVRDVEVKTGEVARVQTDKGPIEPDFLINAAGLYADEISAMAGIDHFRISPRKGEYYIFDKSLSGFVNHILFPVPTPVSKGIVLAPTVEGNLLVGPNAQDVEDKNDTTTTSRGLEEVLRGALKLVPKLSLKRDAVIASYSGLRAEPSTGDFIVEAYEEVHGYINVAGIKSPGLASAPAIAETAIDILEERGLRLQKKETFDPYRRSIDRPFHDLSTEEAKRLVAQDPSYGRVVCRCEHVTEGEVLESIRRGATTLDGVKYRTRAGMGRCQGGFCTPHVVKMISRELGIPAENVTKRGGGSQLLTSKVKELLLR